MIYVFIGIVIFVIISLLIAGHEHMEKVKNDAAQIPKDAKNTICKRTHDSLHDIQECHHDQMNFKDE